MIAPTACAPECHRFIIHGGDLEVVEGKWPGHLIAIEFEDREQARAWYRSTAYQEILPLRTGNSTGRVALAAGASADHKATDVLAGQAADVSV